MPDSNKPFLLPVQTVTAVQAATGRSDALPPEMLESFRHWLSAEWQGAVRRSSQMNLTKADVDTFYKHYRAFCAAIEKLQNRVLPPPRIPTSGGLTAWDDWRETYEQFGYVRGRREAHDWLLIGALLAVRHIAIGEEIPAAPGKGPWMRYLKIALGELAAYAPAEAGSYFAAPKASTLAQQIEGLKRLSIRQASRQLIKVLEAWSLNDPDR